MRAIVQSVYGPPEALEFREIDVPTVRDDEVLVRVRASSVNPADWFVATGRPFAVRFMTGLFRPSHRVPGMDVAGVVESVGSKVTRFRVGDEVYGEAMGAYAEYVSVLESRLARKPTTLSFEQAASVPMAAVTALQGLRDKAKVRPGDSVLVNGGSGGVGTFAVQIGKALGAHVTAVCSARNADRVRSIGADHVIDYARQDFTATTERYDAIFDLVGSASIASCRACLTERGTYVSSVGSLEWNLRAFLLAMLPRSNVSVLTATPAAKELETLATMIDEGRVTPVIERRFELHEVPRALRLQGEGHAQGKTTIVV